MQQKYIASKLSMKDKSVYARTSGVVSAAMNKNLSRKDFRKELEKNGLSVIFRENDDKHIYGVTFIDHQYKAVFNGLYGNDKRNDNIVENNKYFDFNNYQEGGAQDQLQGQIASAKIPLSRMTSPQLYWVMTGNDFTLDLNNPKEPKVLYVGNNPDRQNIYSAALGLYNSRIVKLINKKGQLKSSVIIDELPNYVF